MSARVWPVVARLFGLVIAVTLAQGMFSPANAQQTPARLNYEYKLIVPPQPTATAERIEVI